ncbi:MAG: hypothetical protein CMH27_06900 [Micavibrio sp.]|nr:hypothetical protein [Micavibrio sp.]
MRDGPKLLSMHLGMTGACLQGQEEAVRVLTEMVRGIQLYQKSKYNPERSPRDLIWQEGESRLYRIRGPEGTDAEENPVCVLIPSLINGSSILDLCAERSLASWLSEQGLNVYLFDWGDLMKEANDITIETLVCDRMVHAIKRLKSVSRLKNSTIHGLGYCMGGALSLGALSHEPDLFNSMTLLATPWDFYAGQKTLLHHVQFWAPSALSAIENKKYLSADQLQSLFAGVDPMLAQKKFSRFSKMDMDSESARIFVAVEDWINDGKDLPLNIAKECISDWFISNAPYAGKWFLKGKAVDPSTMNIPVHIVASPKDQLVEYDAALSIKEALPEADVTLPSCGHIGMIAGKDSIEQVWQPMAKWMKKHS